MVAMKKDSDRVIHEESCVAYDDGSAQCGLGQRSLAWNPACREVPVAHREPSEGDGFLARLYAAQE